MLIIMLIYIINNRTTNLYDNYNVIYGVVVLCDLTSLSELQYRGSQGVSPL